MTDPQISTTAGESPLMDSPSDRQNFYGFAAPRRASFAPTDFGSRPQFDPASLGRRSSLWNSSASNDNASTMEELSIPLQAKKTHRSLSFSHGQRIDSQHQQAGSHMLDSFSEEDSQATTPVNGQLDEKEISDRLRAANLNDISGLSPTTHNFGPQNLASQHQYNASMQREPPLYAHPPIGQGSLWFGQTASRRHSYAGENLPAPAPAADPMGQNTQAQVQVQGGIQQQSQPKQVQKPSSVRYGPSQGHGKPPAPVNEAVDRYFSNDPNGRNSLASPPNSPASAKALTNELPAAMESIITVPSKKLYYVQFKSGRTDVFFVADSTALNVTIGDLVIVDADRGRDLGKVIKDGVSPQEAAMLKLRRHQEQQAILQHSPGVSQSSNTNTAPGVTMPKQILRFAQPNEAKQILNKLEDEERAVQTCLQKVAEKGLDMSVLDAEYQWDRRKLTFFYSASHRIDFRDLVRDLFRIYKTRIWMCAVGARATSTGPGHGPRHHQQAPSPSSQTSDSASTAGSASATLSNATVIGGPLNLGISYTKSAAGAASGGGAPVPTPSGPFNGAPMPPMVPVGYVEGMPPIFGSAHPGYLAQLGQQPLQLGGSGSPQQQPAQHYPGGVPPPPPPGGPQAIGGLGSGPNSGAGDYWGPNLSPTTSNLSGEQAYPPRQRPSGSGYSHFDGYATTAPSMRSNSQYYYY